MSGKTANRVKDNVRLKASHHKALKHLVETDDYSKQHHIDAALDMYLEALLGELDNV